MNIIMCINIMCKYNIYMCEPGEPWEPPSHLSVFAYIYIYIFMHPPICIYMYIH